MSLNDISDINKQTYKQNKERKRTFKTELKKTQQLTSQPNPKKIKKHLAKQNKPNPQNKNKPRKKVWN